MKIAFLHQPLGTLSPPNIEGSVDIVTYEMARHLARHCDVVVYSKRGRSQKEFEYHQGVHHRRISANMDQKFDYLASGIDKRLYRFYNFKHPLFASGLYYFMYALRVSKDLRSEKCDIVHIQNFSQFVPIIREFNPEIKIVLHMHCNWLTQLNRAMIESRLKHVDLVVGCSEYVTGKIRRRFPQFAERCKTVFNGVDVTRFINENGRGKFKKNDSRRLLFVGRVSPEKGVHVLLDAFRKVMEYYPQVQLKIVGAHRSLPIEFLVALSDDLKASELAAFYKGNYTSHLQSMVSPDMTSHVSFTGSIPYKQLVNFYLDADMLILPSVSGEAFGMPIIEAMATGIPAVATRCGGIPEIVVNGKTGLLVERGDASALAEAILRLLSDENLLKSMGKAARRRAVELFSWERTADNLLSHYKKLCEDN